MSWLAQHAGQLLRLVGSRRADGRHRAPGVQCDLGTVLDLSRSGARVRVRNDSPLVEGDSVAVSLSVGDERFAVNARVVWIAPAGLRGAEAGLEFAEPSEHAREVLSRLAERFAAWSREDEASHQRRRAG